MTITSTLVQTGELDPDRDRLGQLDELTAWDEHSWAPQAQPDPLATELANCLDSDPDLFFAESPAELELAKLVCTDCPIRAECLAGALSRREPHGVWGGELFDNGAVIARKRPRGRPRKHPLPEGEQPAAVSHDHRTGVSRAA